jgi:predicted transcriptional regulator of viral defense system
MSLFIRMPGARSKQLAAVAADNLGYVTNDDAHALSIPIGTVNAMARRGQLARVAHGIYRLPLIPATPLDAYKLGALWPDRRGLVSHASALALYDGAEPNSTVIYVTVPSSYRTHREVPAPYVIRHQDIAPEDRSTIHGIPVVSEAVAAAQVEHEKFGWVAGRS